MGIRSEKRKVIQQIVNKDDTSLNLDPEPLLGNGDLHWFQAVAKKPETVKAEETAQDEKGKAE